MPRNTAPTPARVVSHTVARLDIPVDEEFETFRSRYETAVPMFDPQVVGADASWEEVARIGASAPHGFLLYGRVDISPFCALAGYPWRCTTYLMGNHVVAERMYRHDPGVMLYAPLRTVINEDRSGGVHFAIDQPSGRFASFDNPDIAATGRLLDQKLADLLTVLELPVPAVLGGDLRS
jgi:hypothetical protein